MADFISKVTLPNSSNYPIRASAIPYGEVDATSTSTAFTATVPGIYELENGVCMFLRNGQITSESGFTINVNGLGDKPVYSSMATGNDRADPATVATRDTTIFNVAYTMFFVYSTEPNINSGNGGWICYRGYNSDNNTIGYQLRTNSSTLPMTDRVYRYRLLFTSADGTGWTPSTTSTSTNATASRQVNQRPIDPFGQIAYYSATTTVGPGSNPGASSLWQQYVFGLGYSFNRTGAALVLTYPAPVYLKCTPQSNGSAIIDNTTPYVQSLPNSQDGKIYIFLGIAYSATNIELKMNHPIYYYKDNAIRLWSNAAAVSTIEPATANPIVDGTAAVGTSVKYAREDHVHPTDTSRAAVSDLNNYLPLSGGEMTGDIVTPASQEFIIGSTTGGQYITITGSGGDHEIYLHADDVYVPTPRVNSNPTTKLYVDNGLSGKQATLVSGTNIKTINNTSLLGSGDISITTTALTAAEVLSAVETGWGQGYSNADNTEY